MTPETILLFAALAQKLVTAGISTISQIRADLTKGGMSEADVNAICDNIIEDATRRKELADADAAGVVGPSSLGQAGPMDPPAPGSICPTCHQRVPL